MATTRRFLTRLRKAAQDKVYRLKNLETLRIKGKQRYEQTREARVAQVAEYRLANLEKVRAYDRARNKVRRQTKAAYYRAKTVDRRNPKRTPNWSDPRAVELFHETAKAFGYQVDHIIPLRGKLVSGLNAEWNLQFLNPETNQAKFNKFDNDSYQTWRQSGEVGPYFPL